MGGNRAPDGEHDRLQTVLGGLRFQTDGAVFQVAIAKQHFNCSSLTGVPLMGENPLGDGSRGSHWETRLVADEIMAYGNGGVVSSLTLAIMEDTGFYLAQHENAGCLAWGRAQGCAFVSSRCGVRRDDLTARMPPELCAREHPTDQRCTAWEQHEEGGEMQRLCWPPDAFLTTKCAAPDCAREWRSDESGLQQCNAEPMPIRSAQGSRALRAMSATPHRALRDPRAP